MVPAARETNWRASAGTGASIFLTFNLLLNSRVGRNVEEVIADWIVQGWHRFGLRLIVGLFWFIVDVFRRIVETIERLMYTVDEWLRFRSGEGRASLAAKAALGLLWFFVAYVLRFAINVLLEPQINPIKHFPVVTVGHKLLLGGVLACSPALLGSEYGDGRCSGLVRCRHIIWCIPGIFGFLVWELKENWRLYAANRRRRTSPVMIGSHGENMPRLLKPGFHSGTLPKRYAKLRRAERHARAGGSWRAVHKHLQALRRAELSLRRYVEREFLELFAESQCWQAPPSRSKRFAWARIPCGFRWRCSGLADGPLQIAMEVESGWLLAGVTEPGWVERLAAAPTAGACHGDRRPLQVGGGRSGPPADRKRVPAAARRGTMSRPRGWSSGPTSRGGGSPLRSSRRSSGSLRKRSAGCRGGGCRPSSAGGLVFSAVPVTWQRWVEAWNQDVAGQGHPRDGVAPVCVLPPA